MDNKTLQRANYLTKCIEDIKKIKGLYKKHNNIELYKKNNDNFFHKFSFALYTTSALGSIDRRDVVNVPFEAEGLILQILDECEEAFKEELEQL